MGCQLGPASWGYCWACLKEALNPLCLVPSPADVLLLEGVTLTQDARQLNGSERAVLDGLLTPAECGVLLQLAKVRRPMGRWHSC